MPIWLRRYTFKMIEQQILEESQAQEKAINKSSGVEELTSQNRPSVSIPDAVKKASYSTKVAKK